MKRLLPILALFISALLPYAARGEAPFDVEYVDAKNVYIKTPRWHAKEDGKWLFTCRVEASAERLAKPVAHLHLYQSKENDGAQEIVWEKKAIVRRNKFDKSYGSRKANFVRVFVDSLPDDADLITVEFKNSPPSSEE